MAYQGTTHATPNPPMAYPAPGLWGARSTNIVTSTNIVGQQLWRYNTTDATTAIIGTSIYFTDAKGLGMKEGDIVFGSIDTGTSVHMYAGIIGVVSTGGAGIASTNGYISSTR
jgi:hypothetical protein